MEKVFADYTTTYKGWTINVRATDCTRTDGETEIVWYAEGTSRHGDYINSAGRTWRTREDALIAVGNAIDYKIRKRANILP